MKKILKIVSNCIPVKGATRSIVYDLMRRSYFFIPNALFQILTESENLSIKEIVEYYGQENKEIIIEYLDFLRDNDAIIWADNSSKFTTINFDWNYPSVINNAIVELGEYAIANIENIIIQLENLCCHSIQFRSYNNCDIHTINKIVGLVSKSSIHSVEFYIPFIPDSVQDIVKIIEKEPRIMLFCFFNAPNSVIHFQNHNFTKSFYNTTQKISNTINSKVHKNHFVVNMKLFTESQEYNTFFNKKLTIDGNGFIKNAPNSHTNWGKFLEIQINEVIASDAFQKLWKINKNLIARCKDCEFRFMCTDGSNLTYNEDEKIWETDVDCGYNPYTAEWEE